MIKTILVCKTCGWHIEFFNRINLYEEYILSEYNCPGCDNGLITRYFEQV